MPEFDGIDESALLDFVNGREGRRMLKSYAVDVRERARVKAGEIDGQLAFAIVESDVVRDADGIHVDVGYDKRKPGFVLFWHEVGTRDYPATPHLRPALDAG